MTFRPIRDKVLVRRDECDENIGSLIVPATIRERPVEGTVLGVGGGKILGHKLVPLGVSVGDRIVFGRYAGADIKIDGELLTVMREDEIQGLVE